MRWLTLIAVLLLTGCIDFREITPPEPPPPSPTPLQTPARFHASVLFGDGFGVPGSAEPATPTAPRRVVINARLIPGRDARDEPRPIRDDTLRVSGVALAPVRVESDGTRVYEGWIPLPDDPGEGGLLRISLPVATPQGERLPDIEQPVPVRVGGDTLVMKAGDDLHLPLASAWPESPSPSPLNQAWELTVLGGETPVSVSAMGRIPDPLVVPASLAPDSPDDAFSVHLVVNSSINLGSRSGDGYSVEILFHAFLRWTVRQVESVSTG